MTDGGFVMGSVVDENERLINAISGLIEQFPNLRAVPLTDGTVGVIIRPVDCGELDSGR